MFNIFLKNRARTLTTVLILSIFLIAATAFAATEFIKAKKGGVVEVAEGVKLRIRPEGLTANAYVSGEMYAKEEDDDDDDDNEGEAIYFSFKAYNRKGNVELTKPALLYVSWDVIGDLDDLTLYGENGEKVRPDKRSKRGLRYSLDHFSLYYYRRR